MSPRPLACLSLQPYRLGECDCYPHCLHAAAVLNWPSFSCLACQPQPERLDACDPQELWSADVDTVPKDIHDRLCHALLTRGQHALNPVIIMHGKRVGGCATVGAHIATQLPAQTIAITPAPCPLCGTSLNRRAYCKLCRGTVWTRGQAYELADFGHDADLVATVAVSHPEAADAVRWQQLQLCLELEVRVQNA